MDGGTDYHLDWVKKISFLVIPSTEFLKFGLHHLQTESLI